MAINSSYSEFKNYMRPVDLNLAKIEIEFLPIFEIYDFFHLLPLFQPKHFLPKYFYTYLGNVCISEIHVLLKPHLAAIKKKTQQYFAL